MMPIVFMDEAQLGATAMRLGKLVLLHRKNASFPGLRLVDAGLRSVDLNEVTDDRLAQMRKLLSKAGD